MKKFLSILALLLLITVSFLFVYLKSQSLGNEQNFFNQELRTRLAKYIWLRHALGLRFDGDARADYLGQRFDDILIEVDIMDTLAMQLDALDILKKRIAAATGKNTAYIISDRNIPYEGELGDDEISRIASTFRNHHTGGNTAVLHLLYLSKSSEDPDMIGLTHFEDGILLFGENLRNLTESNPETLANFEASTALHEFGHQLGLPHNDRDGCLMNEDVEIGSAWDRPEDVLTDFCQYEFLQIRENEL